MNKWNASNKYFVPIIILAIIFGFILGILLNINFKLSSMEVFPFSDISLSEDSEQNLINISGVSTIQRTINKSIQKAIPSVVNIVAECQKKDTSITYTYLNGNFKSGYETVGAGFVINRRGFIVTNYHVIESAKKLKICFVNSDWQEAKIYAYDKATDIALIKTKNIPKGVRVSKVANSDNVNIGDFALAIGNPYGLEGTVNFGIISGLGRSKIEANSPAGIYKNYIQTDAPINQGNSGGPLLNIDGEVIGMNTAIYSPSEGSIGIGFALPINAVMVIVNDLIKNRKFDLGYLGINYDHSKRFFDLGVMIDSVYTNSPAYTSGFMPGDIIMTCQSKVVRSGWDLDQLLIRYKVGDELNFIIKRENEKFLIKVVLEKS